MATKKNKGKGRWTEQDLRLEAENALAKAKKQDKQKKSLRIDDKTIIMVDKKHLRTKETRQRKRESFIDKINRPHYY